jgi:hypothetical protein
MVSLKTVSGSAGKCMDRFGGAATIRELPIADRIGVAARIAKESEKERVAVKLAERRIKMLLEDFCNKNKDYAAIDALAKRFGITEERIKEIAGKSIRSQINNSHGGGGGASVILEAARVGKHYGLEDEMKEAAMKYVRIKVEYSEGQKTCIKLAREEFGLTEGNVKTAVRATMLSLIQRGLNDQAKTLAKDLEMQAELASAVKQTFYDLQADERYESALRMVKIYGGETFGISWFDYKTLAGKACTELCERGNFREAVNIAIKLELPDQLKDAIISWLEATGNKRVEFKALIRDCGSILGEERVKEIARRTVRAMLKGTTCEAIDALSLATEYDLKERALAVRKNIRIYSSDIFSEGLQYSLDLSLKEGLTDEARRIRKMMATREIIFESDQNSTAFEQLREKSGITDEDVQEAAKSTIVRMLRDGRYETAKNIAERYRLNEEARAITEIIGTLNGKDG